MRRWRHPLLLVALALVLAACGAPANSGGHSQAGAVPAATRPAVPFVAAPSPALPTAPPTAPPSTTPIAATAGGAALPPASCPVTQAPAPPFTPPAPYPPTPPPLYGGRFWYGTAALWTWLPGDGTWPGRRDKSFWWRGGYDWRTEQQPPLTLTGQRLDAPAPPFADPGPATNGYHDDLGAFMLTMVDLPTPGCWEMVGHYAGTDLRFVVWVTP